MCLGTREKQLSEVKIREKLLQTESITQSAKTDIERPILRALNYVT